MSVQDILNWPAEERAELVARLLDSLDPDTDPDAEQAWGDEVRRRLDDVAAGRVTPLPWADARAAILSDADGDAG